MNPVRVGVLALQGAFALHVAALRRAGADAVEVRTPADLVGLDGLVLPGGESTTISFLLDSSGLRRPLDVAIAAGLPVFGTCAGVILLATEVVDGRDDQRSFGALDVRVRRNGYGRQVDSFEADLRTSVGVGGGAAGGLVHAVFIRAPLIEEVGGKVEVLAEFEDHPVLVRQGSVLAATFHPELSGDDRLHRWFVSAVESSRAVERSPVGLANSPSVEEN